MGATVGLTVLEYATMLDLAKDGALFGCRWSNMGNTRLRLTPGRMKMPMRYVEVLQQLGSLSNPQAIASMARFGINPNNTYGVSIPILRKMAKEIGRDHFLAQQLWASGIHEARILASMIDEPKKVTEEQMESWVKEFDSWDVCDQCCGNLFDKTGLAYQKAVEWSGKEEEFVKEQRSPLWLVWLCTTKMH